MLCWDWVWFVRKLQCKFQLSWLTDNKNKVYTFIRNLTYQMKMVFLSEWNQSCCIWEEKKVSSSVWHPESSIWRPPSGDVYCVVWVNEACHSQPQSQPYWPTYPSSGYRWIQHDQWVWQPNFPYFTWVINS